MNDVTLSALAQHSDILHTSVLEAYHNTFVEVRPGLQQRVREENIVEGSFVQTQEYVEG